MIIAGMILQKNNIYHPRIVPSNILIDVHSNYILSI